LETGSSVDTSPNSDNPDYQRSQPSGFLVAGFLEIPDLSTSPQSIDELKVAIRAEISLIKPNDLKKAVLHFADLHQQLLSKTVAILSICLKIIL